MDDLASLLDELFEFAMARRVGDFVDVGRVMAGVDVVTEPSRLGRIIGRFVAPARGRLIAAAKVSERLVGVWLPDAARDGIAALLKEPVVVPRAVIDEVVKSEEVRATVKQLLE